MKILWIKTDFLHPTDRGGQIRTLETLKRLHARHEVHYVAYDNPALPEGLARAREYCTRAYPVAHSVPDKASLAFAGQLAAGLVSPLPVAVSRWRSAAMRETIAGLTHQQRFDSVVCDFLFPAPNVPDLPACTLFQHNVEALIWERHAQQGATPFHRAYFRLQAKRMNAFEAQVCRTVRNVIAVSEADANIMRENYGVRQVEAVPTGVDTGFFQPPPGNQPKQFQIVFLGSMDWLPNVDGMKWFAADIWPRIRQRCPQATLAIVGRKPTAAVQALASSESGITVTGTVPDVRPWLHGSQVSIVPLRIGGGTRLKIYEAMAAQVAVVSTTIGAEGLDCAHGSTIRIADNPESFANECVALMNQPEVARQQAQQAAALVASRYSWEAVTLQFERLLH